MLFISCFYFNPKRLQRYKNKFKRGWGKEGLIIILGTGAKDKKFILNLYNEYTSLKLRELEELPRF